jgi:photosystem II stability/assembly factor-like uncharacterized protein
MRLLCTLLFLSLSSISTAQWHRLPGPPGGGPYCYAEISGTTRIYAGTVDGVWLSTDDMQSWTASGLEGHRVEKLSALVTANKLALFAVADSALYRTTDSGITWIELLSTPYDDASKLIATIFQSGDSLIVGKQDSILISTDIGSHWSFRERTSASIELSDTLGSRLFGLGDGYLWWWQRGYSDWWATNYTITGDVQFFHSDGERLLIGYASHIDESTDSGNTWTTLPYNGMDSLDTVGDYWSLVHKRFANIGSKWIIVEPSGLYRSVDTGKSWSHVTLSADVEDIMSTLYSLGVVDSLFCYGSVSGFYTSSDAISWKGMSQIGPATTINFLTSTGQSLFACIGNSTDHLQYHPTFRGSSHGSRWQASADLPNTSWILGARSAVLALSPRSNAWRWSSDHWDTLKSSFGPWSSATTTIGDTIVASWGSRWSLDTGSTWQARTFVGYLGTMDLIAVQDTIFVLAGVHEYSPYNSFVASTDGGMSWTLRSTILSGPSLGGTTSIICACGDTTQVSYDGGWHWSNVGLLHSYFTKAIGDDLFVAASGNLLPSQNGLFVLSRGGFRQVLEDTLSTIQAMTADDSLLYVGTAQRGLWAEKLANLPLAIASNSTVDAGEFEVYPNPAQSMASVSFMLSGHSHAYVELLNTLGERVALLYNGVLDGGKQELPVTLSGVSAGIYELRLVTSEKSQSTKIVVSQ